MNESNILISCFGPHKTQQHNKTPLNEDAIRIFDEFETEPDTYETTDYLTSDEYEAGYLSDHEPGYYDDDDTDYMYNSEQNEEKWQWPPPETIFAKISTLDEHDANRLAWETLLKHDIPNTAADTDWYPFRNELGLLLFVGRYDPKLGITRNIIQYFLKILRTLQANGHITRDYVIPKNATTVETWWKYIPQPPVRLVLLFLFILAQFLLFAIILSNFG